MEFHGQRGSAWLVFECVPLVTDFMGRVLNFFVGKTNITMVKMELFVTNVLSCNITLHDIVHKLVTNLIRGFPLEGRTAVASPLQFISRALYITVIPLLPSGAYGTCN
jgi:hypothetical protein